MFKLVIHNPYTILIKQELTYYRSIRIIFVKQPRLNHEVELSFDLDNFSKNQSVENAGVAFGKGANERNKFFEKKNKQSVMHDEQMRANKAKD